MDVAVDVVLIDPVEDALVPEHGKHGWLHPGQVQGHSLRLGQLADLGELRGTL